MKKRSSLNWSRLGIAVCAALLLAACATKPPRSTETSVAVPSSESDGDYLLRMAIRLRSLTVADLAAEADSLQKGFAAQRSEENRIRLGAFLAIAQAPVGDRNKALALLDVPPGEAAGRGRNHPIAALLLPLLLDYRRTDDALSIAQLRIKEEQKRNEVLQLTAEQARLSAETSRLNAEAMRLKLEAIRDIEKQLLERPSPK